MVHLKGVIKMIIPILLCAYAIGLTEETSICCEKGILQVDTYECFDSITNSSTPLKLSCVNKAHISEDADYYIKLSEQSDPEDQYCAANTTSESSNLTLVVCELDEPLVEEHVLGICFLVSVAFLVPTVLVYGLLPEMRDTQGKSITNFCANLALALLTMGIIKVQESYASFTACAIGAFFAYFFFLTTFFWMNAIAIQILLNLSRPTTMDRGWRRFLWYALYAYGAPALLTAITLTVNYHPGDHRKPEIGLTTCWFRDSTVQWIYMYSFMAIIVVINFAIFGYITYILWGGKYNSTHTKALKYKLRMTFRLAVIMGLPWIFEMISSLTPPHFIWVITDFYNVLQGPLIFLLLVVFRKRVVKALHRRGWLACVSGPVERWLAKEDDDEAEVEHTTADAELM
ncbi:probable G-protein coupled receptor Mth-like 1 [Aricia agestis]|uniref:probable G-protein coupled receptor Mth-like 1 n=1 Tax=Aricia agestis TaxID=91739 RepID=UPI001C206AE1|nr:probable G-protein coupled receptor Mth-like 1 [Aricia agestis]